MSAYDWQLSAGAPLCPVSDSFYRTVRETIFQQLTKETTTAQWQAAEESLTRLRDELQQAIYPMHYGSLVGRHRCLDHVFREAAARLRNLALLQPEPPPPPEPEPEEEQPPFTHEDVENLFRKLPPDTYFGKERDEDDSQ